MKINKTILFLLLIFAITLTFRIYFSFHANSLSNDEAYFNLRYIKNVVDTKSLMFYDSLSYGGRETLYPPFFYILMALLIFGNIILLKIIPEIFASLLIFIIYLITKEITNDNNTALLASLISAFVPIYLSQTLNIISVYSLALPLLFLMLYSLLKLEDEKYLWIFIICTFILALTHVIAILFILTILIYLFLIAGGAIQATKLKKEAILFSIILIMLIELIIYKKAFLTYGVNIIGQSLPLNILLDNYRAFTLLELVIGIGIIPLVLGVIGVYLGLTKENNKPVYMFSALIVSVLLLLVLRLITISIGMMILGISLSIFAAFAIKSIIMYLNQIKLSWLKNLFIIIFFIIFILFSFIPSYNNSKNLEKISDYKFQDMKWLNKNINNTYTILGNVEEGNLITSIGQRKNVIDTNFILAPNPFERLSDIEKIYTTFSEAKVLELLRKYNINIIYLSEDTKKIYNIDNLSYVKGSSCFRNIREGRIYAVLC